MPSHTRSNALAGTICSVIALREKVISCKDLEAKGEPAKLGRESRLTNADSLRQLVV